MSQVISWECHRALSLELQLKVSMLLYALCQDPKIEQKNEAYTISSYCCFCPFHYSYWHFDFTVANYFQWGHWFPPTFLWIASCDEPNDQGLMDKVPLPGTPCPAAGPKLGAVQTPQATQTEASVAQLETETLLSQLYRPPLGVPRKQSDLTETLGRWRSLS